MADNKTYIIRETRAIHECPECPYDRPNCENNCVCPKEEGKTRAEYEDMIAETLLNQKIVKSGRGLNNHTIGELYDIRKECQQLAKAVVDRLFGEGK